ncbi:glycosyltransferase family protein [Azospirillum sp. sgz301742]
MSNGTASTAAQAMVDFCLEQARGMLALGRMPEARALMNLATQVDPDAVRGAIDRNDPALRALAAQSIVLHSGRGQEIGHPCAILGRAGITLDPRREAMIRWIFDAHQRDFDSGAVPEPPLAGIYGGASDRRGGPDRPVRVFLIMARHIAANPYNMESDLFHHFTRSAAAAGLITRVFEADPLLYDSPKRYPYSDTMIDAARRALEGDLADFRPDMILFDGNYFPTERSLGPDWLDAMRRQHGCRVAFVLADCYDTTPNLYGAWAGAADAMVLFNRETTYPMRCRQADKAFYACGVPFDEQLFAATEEDKDGDMVLIGTNHRSRADLVALIDAHGIPITARLHTRLAQDAPNIEEYAAILRWAKMTFNTGRVEDSRSLSIVTGRCFEAILSRTVLLEEAGSGLNDYFLPFVHYVPFANTAQLVMFAQFLRANDDYRRRIADQALSWHQQRYRSDQFWSALLARLGFR